MTKLLVEAESDSYRKAHQPPLCKLTQGHVTRGEHLPEYGCGLRLSGTPLRRGGRGLSEALAAILLSDGASVAVLGVVAGLQKPRVSGGSVLDQC